MNTLRQLNIASTAQGKSMEKLSSGLRINKAGDDAAGLAISEKMRGQIRGLDQASRNAQDGISMLQTVEGAMNETHDILQRMRELAVQGASDTNVTADRVAIKDELSALHKEITRISKDTDFNTQKLIGTAGASVKFHIGANAGQTISATFVNLGATAATIAISAGALNISAGRSVADALITKVNSAITNVSSERSKLGSVQNRLEHTINNLNNASENLTSAESRIRDVDYALAA